MYRRPFMNTRFVPNNSALPIRHSVAFDSHIAYVINVHCIQTGALNQVEKCPFRKILESPDISRDDASDEIR